jgi:hypothetical protein
MPNGPRDTWLLVSGCDLTPHTMEMSDSVANKLEEVRPYGDNFEKSLPIGVGSTELESGGGLYTDEQKAMLLALEGAAGSRQLVAYGFAGSDPGAPCTLLDGAFVAKFNRTCSLSELTKASPEYKVTGAHARGVVLHGREEIIVADFDTEAEPSDRALEQFVRSIAVVSSVLQSTSPAVTVITTATAHGLESTETILLAGHTSTPDINGGYAVTVLSPTTFSIAAITGAGSPGGTGGTIRKTSSVGGFADVHVVELDLDTHTGLDLEVITSADGITYLPAITFATITASEPTQRQRVETGSQLERFCAVAGDFAGAGSPTARVFVGLHRNA